MTDLLQLYTERGFLQDATPGLAERLAAGPITAYIGFDPTADSLHVGSLVPVMGLAWLQRGGGTPIALVGGGTAMVGDPSGKRAERPVLSVEAIDANAAALRTQLARFLRFRPAADVERDGARGAGRREDREPGANWARMRNNADWLRSLGLMEFLRDAGKHFTVGYMLQKEAVRSRLETGISFTEFSYMLIQAYDYWHLWRTEGCELQMGGSDQWGNITAGIELIARREQREVHGLVFPLITTATGAKFGKSEEGNVWLDPARTSPYRFYQFWLNSDDRDVERYLKLFTFLPLDEIAEVAAEQAREPARRPGQRRLAWEVTALVHGEAEANGAREASEALFAGGTDRPTLSNSALAVIAESAEMPSCVYPRMDFSDKAPLVDVLVRCGLASSKSDARRGIQGGGYYVNGEQVDDVGRWLTLDDFGGRDFVLLRKGKKNYVKLVLG
ncbi:MAG TPA: tyrosine--tRNA ligase [Gemmatimonadales bacterium]|nr:tyrosine--tRNA ligase [Gemmatimonadales bacterium]